MNCKVFFELNCKVLHAQKSTTAQKPYSGSSGEQNYMIKPKEPEPDDGKTSDANISKFSIAK